MLHTCTPASALPASVPSASCTPTDIEMKQVRYYLKKKKEKNWLELVSARDEFH
jgi:hypothetical protein